jgi:hypothetical protein
MKVTITIDGDEKLVAAFIGAGLRAANAESDQPLPVNVLREHTADAFRQAMATGTGGFALGDARIGSEPRKIIRGSPAVRDAASKRLAAGIAKPACQETPAIQQLPTEGTR